MKKTYKLVLKFYDQIIDHNLFTLAGSLAFSLALAISPFILLVLVTLSTLGTQMQDQLIIQSRDLFGADAAMTIEAVIQNVDKNSSLSGISGILSILIVLFSVSAIFSQLRSALDRISDLKTVNKDLTIFEYFKERAFLMTLLIGFVFLMITSLMVNSLISTIIGSFEGFIWQGINQIISLIMFTTLFTAIFYFTPTAQMRWKDCFISGITASLFFNFGKYLIGTYLGQSGVGTAYGAAGSFVVLLVWLYYSSLTFFISFEFSTDFFINHQRKISNEEAKI